MSDTVDTTMYGEILQEIAKQTTNDVIVFSIVIVVALILIMIPAIILFNKSKKDDHRMNLEEKRLIVSVVERNTDAFSTLKGTIESTNEALLTSLHNLEKASVDTQVNMSKIMSDQDDVKAVVYGIKDSTDGISEQRKMITQQMEILTDVRITANDTNKQVGRISNSIDDALSKKTTTKPKRTTKKTTHTEE